MIFDSHARLPTVHVNVIRGLVRDRYRYPDIVSHHVPFATRPGRWQGSISDS